MMSLQEGEGRRSGGQLGFVVIGVMKMASAVLLTAAGFGLFRLFRGDAAAGLEHAVLRLHLDPENRLIREAVARVSGLDRTHVKAIEIGAFLYALLHLIEGTGLLLRKRWAEYFTVVITGSLLPLELYEVARKPTALRVGVMAVNVAVVVYLLVKLRQQHREEKAAR